MEKKSDAYQITTDIQWEYAGDGIVRQIMGYDEHLMMVKVKFNQGAIGTLHQHPHAQSTYVASGCFEVTIGDKKTGSQGWRWLLRGFQPAARLHLLRGWHPYRHVQPYA